MSEHADIVDVIALALADHRNHLPKPGKLPTGWGPNIIQFRPIAEIIMMRLQGQGFTVERKAPAAGHSTP